MSFLQKVFNFKGNKNNNNNNTKENEEEINIIEIPIKDWQLNHLKLFLEILNEREGNNNNNNNNDPTIITIQPTTIQFFEKEEWDGKSLLCFTAQDLIDKGIDREEAFQIEFSIKQVIKYQNEQMVEVDTESYTTEVDDNDISSPNEISINSNIKSKSLPNANHSPKLMTKTSSGTYLTNNSSTTTTSPTTISTNNSKFSQQQHNNSSLNQSTPTTPTIMTSPKTPNNTTSTMNQLLNSERTRSPSAPLDVNNSIPRKPSANLLERQRLVEEALRKQGSFSDLKKISNSSDNFSKQQQQQQKPIKINATSTTTNNNNNNNTTTSVSPPTPNNNNNNSNNNLRNSINLVLNNAHTSNNRNSERNLYKDAMLSGSYIGKRLSERSARRPSCIIEQNLDEFVKTIDEQKIPQTFHYEMLNNDLVLIEQLSKYKQRYKNLYLKLAGRLDEVENLQKQQQLLAPPPKSEKKKILGFNSSSNDDYDLMFGDPSEYAANNARASVVVDHVPVIIDTKSLTEVEYRCVTNVYKKFLSLDKRKFSKQEKIFLSENLALPDCYKYFFFDNPTGENVGGLNNGEAVERNNNNTNNQNSMTDDKKKKNITKTPMIEPFLQIQLVIFEFDNSYFIKDMNDSNKFTYYRTGIMIGNWFLEWRENSLVIPTRKAPYRLNPHYHFIPLQKIEGAKNIDRILHKLSSVCALWNGTFVYDLKECNHQHFVRDIINALGVIPKMRQDAINDDLLKQGKEIVDDSFINNDNDINQQIPFGLSIEKLLKRILRYGYSDMAFYVNSTLESYLFPQKKSSVDINTLSSSFDAPQSEIRNKYSYQSLQKQMSTSNNNTKSTEEEGRYVVFKSHRDIDNFYLKIEMACADYFTGTSEGKWDRWLLRLFDRSFWIRLSDKEIAQEKDLPLANSSNDFAEAFRSSIYSQEKRQTLCPFNMEGKTIAEIDILTLVVNSGPTSAYLGDYDPIVPNRNWKLYEPNAATNQ
ncbi:hypothetical protein ABK040_004500 [Willaertia magna]